MLAKMASILIESMACIISLLSHGFGHAGRVRVQQFDGGVVKTVGRACQYQSKKPKKSVFQSGSE